MQLEERLQKASGEVKLDILETGKRFFSLTVLRFVSRK